MLPFATCSFSCAIPTLAGSRAKAVTTCPRCSARATSARPVPPVAPKTSTFTASSPICCGGHSANPSYRVLPCVVRSTISSASISQGGLGPLQLRRSAGDRAPAADLGDVVPLHRHLRIVRRLLGGLPASPQDAVPGGNGEPRISGPTGRLALAAARRAPLR